MYYLATAKTISKGDQDDDDDDATATAYVIIVTIYISDQLQLLYASTNCNW